MCSHCLSGMGSKCLCNAMHKMYRNSESNLNLLQSFYVCLKIQRLLPVSLLVLCVLCRKFSELFPAACSHSWLLVVVLAHVLFLTSWMGMGLKTISLIWYRREKWSKFCMEPICQSHRCMLVSQRNWDCFSAGKEAFPETGTAITCFLLYFDSGRVLSEMPSCVWGDRVSGMMVVRNDLEFFHMKEPLKCIIKTTFVLHCSVFQLAMRS